MTTRSCVPFVPLAAGLLVAVLIPISLPAQSAEEVLQQARQAHRERTADIENYTVVQSVIGFTTTTYFERRAVNGESVLVPVSTSGSEAGQQLPESPYRLYDKLLGRSQLVGTEEVAGHPCHLIEATDLEGTGFETMGTDSGTGWTPERLRLWLDTDSYVVRKVAVSGTTSSGAEPPSEASVTIHLEDYREVKGLRYPFRMRMESSGIAGPMSAEERAQMQKSLAQMRAQMKKMSDQQRQMMETMMGGQLKKMEKMLSTGALDLTVTVQDLRVNEGPPDDS